MKLGLFCMPLHPPGRLHAETYDEDLEMIARADKLGFSEVWIGEHFILPWENIPAPDLFIARALGVTEQIVMGTGVVLLHLHDPVMVAHRMAMLDHLAKGRFFFGIGAAATPSDFQMFGLDPESVNVRARMRESIEVILKLWSEDEPFEHDGEFFHVKRPEDQPEIQLAFHMKPYQKPHPPIALAGSSPKSETLEMAGEGGWWPLSSSFLQTSSLPSHWGAVEKGAARSGKTASRSTWRIAREVHVAKTTEQAKEEALNGPMGTSFVNYWMKLFGNGPRGVAAFKTDPDMPDEAVTPQHMMDNFWIVGDPDECIQKIRQLYKDVGGFGTLLPLCHDWGKNKDQWYSSMELMTTEVLPGLQDLVSN